MVSAIIQAFFPASAFVLVDMNEACKPQRFIHVTVGKYGKKRKPEY